MDDRRRVKISKYLSKHLRHEPERLGLTLAPGGWVPIAELLDACSRHHFPVERAELNGARPLEIFKASSGGGAALALTHLNDQLLEARQLTALEEFSVEGGERARVQGFIDLGLHGLRNLQQMQNDFLIFAEDIARRRSVSISA